MFSSLLNTFITYLDLKAENYSDRTICKIIFQYHICNPKNKQIKTHLSHSFKTTDIPKFSFSGYNLPVTTNFYKWGVTVNESDNTFLIRKGNRMYHIVRDLDKQTVQIKTDGNLLFEFTDIFGINHKSFTRILKNQEYKFIDGTLVLKKLVRKTDYITKIKLNKNINNKFLTLDLETRTINGKMVPYCVSIFNGFKAHSFYLSDYSNSEEMLITAISSLFRRSYNKHKIYIHNLSHFDGIFLFRFIK